MGYDIDATTVTGELAEFKFAIVPTDSALAGPQLTVRYAPLPEPGMAIAVGIGALALGAFGRRSRVRPESDEVRRRD